MDLRLKAMEALGNLLVLVTFMVHLRHAISEFFHLALHVMDVFKNREAFSEHSAAGERETILGQVAAAHAALAVGGTVVKPINPGENLQQRGLSCAIRAHQTNTVVRGDEPVEILEQDFWAKTLAGLGELDHYIYLITEAELKPTAEARSRGENQNIGEACRCVDAPRLPALRLTPCPIVLANHGIQLPVREHRK